ncbi:hypothetical protein EVAR_226_1 [Eumeta japonica]|uniref:Uncharacterized protein n=1 Tax=Eumeta variegata TaxID=151549 RepID=A0A4C1SA38_EUMVA|nr:hypothetical protein EVAR_226_1 [Eumeta japonica]
MIVMYGLLTGAATRRAPNGGDVTPGRERKERVIDGVSAREKKRQRDERGEELKSGIGTKSILGMISGSVAGSSFDQDQNPDQNSSPMRIKLRPKASSDIKSNNEISFAQFTIMVQYTHEPPPL